MNVAAALMNVAAALVIVGSLANRNDHSIVVRQHIVSVDLTPLMSRRRTAKVVLPIIDLVAPVPVFLLNLRARFPFVVLLIGVVVVMILVLMILGHCRHAGESHGQNG